MSWILRLILFGCLVIVLPLVIMTTIRVYVASLTNIQIGYIGIGLAVTGLVGFILLMIAQSAGKSERNARARIGELRKLNQALHYEQEVALTPRDIASLRIYKTTVLFGLIIAGLLVAMLVADFSEIKPAWKPFAGGLTVLLFAFLGWWMNKRANVMLGKGKKSVIRGIITDKNTTFEGRSEKTKHWIYIGDHRIAVNMFTYGKYRVGNAAEFHLFESFGNLILHHEKLDGAGLDDTKKS